MRLCGACRLEHEAWLAFIEHQPQTLTHLDAFRRNLFTRHAQFGDMQTILIDGNVAGGENRASGCGQPQLPGNRCRARGGLDKIVGLAGLGEGRLAGLFTVGALHLGSRVMP